MEIKFGNMPQSVLVTGATGFIGQHLVRALINDGHQVTVLTRDIHKAKKIFKEQVNCISSMSTLSDEIVFNVIINLAGARILGWWWSESRKKILRASRIELTNQLVAWVQRAKTKPNLLLSGSAIGYYGIQKIGDSSELTEESPTQSIFMAQLCHDWEKAAQAASLYNVHVICMRFGLVLGKQGALPMLLLPIKLFLGGKLATGKQWLSWIHVDDVVNGIAHLWRLHNKLADNNPSQQVYNFTAPESLSQFEFSRRAADILSRPCFFPTPGWPMRLALGEQADLLLEGQRVVPKALLDSGFSFLYPDATSALRSLL